MKQNFKEGDLVRIIGVTGSPQLHCIGFLGIVCETSKWTRESARFLVHLQSGSKHWFFDDEIRKATDDGTTI